MKRALLLATILSTPALAQELVPPPIQPQVSADRPEWENPAINAIGKLPAHSSGFPYETRAKALTARIATSSRYLSLDGPWRFAFAEKVDDKPEGFWRENYDVSGWKTIPVPSDWQAHGYGQARYNNIRYPFPPNRPLIDHSINSVDSYRRNFSLPAHWKGDQQVQQGCCAGVVADLPSGHEEAQGVAVRVGHGMELGVHAAFGTAESPF